MNIDGSWMQPDHSAAGGLYYYKTLGPSAPLRLMLAQANLSTAALHVGPR